MTEATKTCTKCDQTKRLTEYHRQSRAKDGRRNDCRLCANAAAAAHHAENREARAEYDATYRAANRERIRESGAKWRAENNARISARVAAYHAENRDRRAEYMAEWRSANREHVAEYNASYRTKTPHTGWEAGYRSRCREYGFEPVIRSFTREEMISYWGNRGKCIYCDAPFTEIDHLIPVGMGGHHVIENVAPSCMPCNKQNVNAIRIARQAMVPA